nr:hypothetical protein [Tanacetum cinerariifolium]
RASGKEKAWTRQKRGPPRTAGAGRWERGYSNGRGRAGLRPALPGAATTASAETSRPRLPAKLVSSKVQTPMARGAAKLV